MAEHQLPAYLQARQVQDFTDYASDGIGAGLPAHVSIQGNMFTLIDAAGTEFDPPLRELDCVLVDRSNVACKMYYGRPWVSGSEEPPMCWSTNGIGPSKDAAAPQARTCAECKLNERGSAVSAMSGANIKACRDEYHFAILVPTIPMMFRFVLTPGSFKNYAAYTTKFKNGNVKISMVVTKLTFVPKVNGEIDFTSVSYVDEQTNSLVVKALAEKATDLLCGRLDSPRVAAIAGPTFNVPQVNGPGDVASHVSPVPIPPMQQTAPQVQQQVPFVPPAGAPSAPVAQASTPVQTATAAGPPSEQPTTRRRRRTAAEMAAANNGGATAALANGAGVAPAPAGVGGAAPRAPFPNPGQAAPASNNFGIAEGQPAAGNPELAGMLDDFFK